MMNTVRRGRGRPKGSKSGFIHLPDNGCKVADNYLKDKGELEKSTCLNCPFDVCVEERGRRIN